LQWNVPSKNGSIIVIDLHDNALERLEFSDSQITQISFPACDARFFVQAQSKYLKSVLSAATSTLTDFHPSSMDPFITLDLAAVHDAPGPRIERVTPMQHRKIVPH